MKKVVKIFGVGSAKDRALILSVELAAKELGIIVDIHRISNIKDLIKSGISAIPAMAIGEELVAHGRVPGIAEIKQMLQN